MWIEDGRKQKTGASEERRRRGWMGRGLIIKMNLTATRFVSLWQPPIITKPRHPTRFLTSPFITFTHQPP